MGVTMIYPCPGYRSYLLQGPHVVYLGVHDRSAMSGLQQDYTPLYVLLQSTATQNGNQHIRRRE